MNDQPYRDPFVTYLEECRDQEDRAALAAMRRWLSQPTLYSEATPYVQRRLSINASPAQEATYYLIGGLFALHDESAEGGNMGDHFRKMCEDPNDPPPNVELRFMALLASDSTQIDTALRQAVTLLKANGVSVNWHQLVGDIRQIKEKIQEDRLEVQRRWARRFWGQPPAEKKEQTESAT